MNAFDKMLILFKDKKRIDFRAIIDEFEKSAKPKPSMKLLKHLDAVAKKMDEIPTIKALDGFKNLPMELHKFYGKVSHMRKSFLCSLCNWRNHKYIDAEAKTITFNEKFCKKLVFHTIDTIVKRYEIYIQYLLLLDEFVFIISEQRLLTKKIDRKIFRRYLMLIAKCKNNPTDAVACAPLCRQFNLNRFTYMFDGESKMIIKFVELYRVISYLLKGEKSSFRKLFRMRKKRWKHNILKKFKRKDSILSKKMTKDPTIKTIKKNEFDLNFKTQAMKNYIERKHPLSEIQIELLDDELSAITLFKLADAPIDISRFAVKFDKNGGLDVIKDSKKVNIDLSAHKILALIHKKSANTNDINEHIDDHVKLLLKQLKITDLSRFLIDASMIFNVMGKMDEQMKDIINASGKKKAVKKPAKAARKMLGVSIKQILLSVFVLTLF